MVLAHRRSFMQRMQLTNPLFKRQEGMTIVEVIVVIVIIGVLFPLFATILGMYQQSIQSDDKVKLQGEITQGLRYMDDNVRVANRFMATVPSVYSDNYGPRNTGTSGANAWSYKGNSATDRVLITQSFATTINALNTGRQPIFMNTPAFNCTTQMYYQPQLNYITIYFLRDNTLYRRVLTDTTSSVCPGNVQQQRQSCPPEIVPAARHASCRANDEILVSQVDSFLLEYFQISQDGTSVQIDPDYSSLDPEILVAVDYVNVTIVKSARGGAVTSTITQRISKVNQ